MDVNVSGSVSSTSTYSDYSSSKTAEKKSSESKEDKAAVYEKSEAKSSAQTKAQAQADISEDGYYGVKQTSERMFDFAMALAGDDVDKMKEMQAAVKKGYEQAEKTWGGKLPSICSETLDAVNKLFDDYYKSKSTTTE